MRRSTRTPKKIEAYDPDEESSKPQLASAKKPARARKAKITRNYVGTESVLSGECDDNGAPPVPPARGTVAAPGMCASREDYVQHTPLYILVYAVSQRCGRQISRTIKLMAAMS